MGKKSNTPKVAIDPYERTALTDPIFVKEDKVHLTRTIVVDGRKLLSPETITLPEYLARCQKFGIPPKQKVIG